MEPPQPHLQIGGPARQALAAPPVAAKYHGMRQALRVEAGLLVTIASYLTLIELGLIAFSGTGGALALVLALAPVPLLFALGLWLDRFEPEPVWLLARLFLWGATASIAVAGLLNGITAAAAGRTAAAVISAPIVEETMKGLALLWVLRRRREHFTGVLDAVIYALFIGLGFAVVENVTYYAAAFQTRGTEGLAGIVVMRGVLTPFLHPFLTMFTALGLALGMRRRGVARYLLPMAGFATAVFLHALWNTGLGVVLYPILFLPAFIFVVRRALRQRRAEADILCRELEPELRSGVLSQQQHELLRSAPIDLRGYAGALRSSSHPLHAWRRTHHAAFALASYRRAHRVAGAPSGVSEVEEALRLQLATSLRAAGGPVG